jgi:hypothetical protein
MLRSTAQLADTLAGCSPDPALERPYLYIAKDGYCRIGISIGVHPNRTGSIGRVVRALDVLAVDIEIESTAASNDRQRIDPIETRPDRPTRSAGYGVIAIPAALSGEVFLEEVGIGAINADAKVKTGSDLGGIEITAKVQAPRVPPNHRHLYLIGKVAEIRDPRGASSEVPRMSKGIVGTLNEGTPVWNVPTDTGITPAVVVCFRQRVYQIRVSGCYLLRIFVKLRGIPLFFTPVQTNATS